MRIIPRWLRAMFAWRTVRSTGVWVYFENSITGQRKAVWRGGGYQPLAGGFLHIGDIVVGPRGTYVVGTEGEILRTAGGLSNNLPSAVYISSAGSIGRHPHPRCAVIKLRYASIQRTESGCTTHFLDGSSVDSIPHDTHHYHVISHRCGYGDDIMAYNFEHDFLHSFLCEFLFDEPSRVLWSEAHGGSLLGEHAAFEEISVQTFQRFLRANERPIVSDVDWDHLRREAMAMLEVAL